MFLQPSLLGMRPSFSWALRHLRPDGGFPVSGVTPRATSLQILSCRCYEQSVHALSPKEWMQARHSREPFRFPDCAELAPPRKTDDPGDREPNAPGRQCLHRLGQLTLS